MTSTTSKKINLKVLMNGPDITLKQNYLRGDFGGYRCNFNSCIITIHLLLHKTQPKQGQKMGQIEELNQPFNINESSSSWYRSFILIFFCLLSLFPSNLMGETENSFSGSECAKMFNVTHHGALRTRDIAFHYKIQIFIQIDEWLPDDIIDNSGGICE